MSSLSAARAIDNELNRQVAAKNPLDDATSCAYDESGKEVSVVAPGGGTTSYVYDEVGDQIGPIGL